VHDESILVRGILRDALQVGGAHRAYERHSTIKSRVCVSRVRAVLEEHTSYVSSRHTSTATTTSTLEEQYAQGLRRLGVLKPTKIVPEESACDGTAACSCFMARATWRAGVTWFLVYAMLPPRPRRRTTAVMPQPTMPSWVDRLLDANESAASESEDFVGDIAPSDWMTTTPHALLCAMHMDPASLVSMIRYTTDGHSDANTSTSDTSADDSSSARYESFISRVATATLSSLAFSTTAVAWLCTRRTLRRDLLTFSRCLSIYHRASLEHVVSSSRRRVLVRNTFETVIAAHADDSTLIAAAASASSAADACTRIVALFSTSTNAWTAPRTSDRRMHVVTHTGYALVVAVSIVLALHTFVSTTRLVNEWRHYCISPAIERALEEQAPTLLCHRQRRHLQECVDDSRASVVSYDSTRGDSVLW
jgi:hypothetical protein